MTKKERIAQLEEEVAQLKIEIAALRNASPLVIYPNDPVPYWQRPGYPGGPPLVTWGEIQVTPITSNSATIVC